MTPGTIVACDITRRFFSFFVTFRLLVQLRHGGAVELGADGRRAVSPRLVEVVGRAGPFDGIRTGTNRILQALRARPSSGFGRRTIACSARNHIAVTYSTEND